MSCNSDLNNNLIMDLNNNYIDLNAINDLTDTFDTSVSNDLIENDNQTTIENEFSANSFQNRNIQHTRDDIEFIVDTYLFIEKTKSLLLCFCF